MRNDDVKQLLNATAVCGLTTALYWRCSLAAADLPRPNIVSSDGRSAVR
jgi:hypothetical protein